MATTVAVIAQGEMGAGIGERLASRGARVITSLAGRSAASAARAKAAGMEPIGDDTRLVAEADFLLSVIPPGEAVAFARRFAPALAASAKKPVFIECNAISAARVEEVAAIIAPTGAPFVDGGIVGAPPSKDKPGGRIYVSGPEAQRAMSLRAFGLDLRLAAGGIGAASAVKCSYAALTKGTQALGVALILGAMRAGVADEVRSELQTSQPQLWTYLEKQIPNMYRKAYRWVAEMEEIGEHLGLAEPGARDIYRGMARLYEHLGKEQIAVLDKFLGR
jgi:3-hydroxyisobutyrate dehydrogenase-like beta-hydroxyacid dehydrogenase